MNIYQILAIVFACIILLSVILIAIIVFIRKRKKTNIYEYSGLLDALGGLTNISSLNHKGSRISVNVNDKKIVDKEKIKQEGIDTIVVSNKKVTMVVDSKKAIEIFNYLNQKELNQ